jgi:hypothetical protein
MQYYRLVIPIPKHPWRWVRFRIATVFLLVVIVALSLSWWRDHKFLAHRLYQMQNPTRAWDVSQATGPPNTKGGGDIPTAWASASQDDQAEWLVLEYDSPVATKAVVIHETYNPGAVIKVTSVSRWGTEKVLWQGSDPTPTSAASGVSRIPLPSAVSTSRIKLYIDSAAVPGWNEIDAVGLEDANGEITWATEASASTSYNGGSTTTMGMYGSVF